MANINILEASLYVGTYKKYNCNSLFGKWLNLKDYELFIKTLNIKNKSSLIIKNNQF